MGPESSGAPPGARMESSGPPISGSMSLDRVSAPLPPAQVSNISQVPSFSPSSASNESAGMPQATISFDAINSPLERFGMPRSEFEGIKSPILVNEKVEQEALPKQQMEAPVQWMDHREIGLAPEIVEAAKRPDGGKLAVEARIQDRTNELAQIYIDENKNNAEIPEVTEWSLPPDLVPEIQSVLEQRAEPAKTDMVELNTNTKEIDRLTKIATFPSWEPSRRQTDAVAALADYDEARGALEQLSMSNIPEIAEEATISLQRHEAVQHILKSAVETEGMESQKNEQIVGMAAQLHYQEKLLRTPDLIKIAASMPEKQRGASTELLKMALSEPQEIAKLNAKQKDSLLREIAKELLHKRLEIEELMEQKDQVLEKEELLLHILEIVHVEFIAKDESEAAEIRQKVAALVQSMGLDAIPYIQSIKGVKEVEGKKEETVVGEP
jgi:hypothetical protein